MILLSQKNNGIFIPPEIFSEIFDYLEWAELLACGLIDPSWYYYAIPFIRRRFRTGLLWHHHKNVRYEMSIIAHSRFSRLGIKNLIGRIEVDISEIPFSSASAFREYQESINVLAKVLHSRCIVFVPLRLVNSYAVARTERFFHGTDLGWRSQLTRVHLSGYTELVGGNSIPRLLITLVNLKEIKLSEFEVTKSIIHLLAHHVELRTLNLTLCRINVSALVDTIPSWPKLRHLNITIRWTDVSTQLSSIVTQLTRSCKELRRLGLHAGESRNSYSPLLEQALINLVRARGPQLTCVHLTGFFCVTDELLVALVRSAKNLDELDLSHCRELTARGVDPGVWPELRILRLDRCRQVEPTWVVETLKSCRLPLTWTADGIHAHTGPYLYGAVREEMME